jgi:hypothetical protein
MYIAMKLLEKDGITLMAPAYRAMLQQTMLSFREDTVETSKRRLTRGIHIF